MLWEDEEGYVEVILDNLLWLKVKADQRSSDRLSLALRVLYLKASILFCRFIWRFHRIVVYLPTGRSLRAEV